MRLFFSILFTLAAFTAIAWFIKTRSRPKYPASSNNNIVKAKEESRKETGRLNHYAAGLENYASREGYNNKICFLVDMRLSSGKKRFFVYDMSRDSVLEAGLVAHGSGSEAVGDSLQFSNETGSNSTSVGKYKIGYAYNGTFGLAYKLYGLDKTNSRAFERFVVLHSHPCVPEVETAPYKICRSWGCPTVAPAFLDKLKGYLDKTGKPILLDIFY